MFLIVPVGMIINSGLKIKILEEFLVNPIVDKRAMKKGERKSINNSVVFLVKDTDSSDSNIIRNPLANKVKRQAANAVRNLPPKSPSTGPDGLMTRQVPNRRSLKTKIVKSLSPISNPKTQLTFEML